MARELIRTISVPPELFRRLELLASQHQRSVEEIVEHAVELHYGEAAASARSRLVDRLARLEAGLGDAAVLTEQIAEDSRRLRAIPTD